MGESKPTSTLIDSDGESKERSGQFQRGKRWRLGLIATALLVVAAVTVCMETVYILQLQRRQNDVNEDVLSRLVDMESKLSSSCPCQTSGEVGRFTDIQKSMHDGMAIKQHSQRTKRQTGQLRLTEDELNETEHIQNEHHGIASSHIALLYADPDQLNRTSAAAISTSALKFKNSTRKYNLCDKVKENGMGDVWCIPHFPEEQPTKFMIRSDTPYYPYFAKADWMNGERARENFQVTGDEQQSLIVRNPGIYIVTSNMHFTEVSTGIVHYGVFVRNESNAINSERVLGLCAATVSSGTADGALYPCSTWQLAPLKRGDRVFMRINPLAWFRVQKETFFLALIKLNDFQF